MARTKILTDKQEKELIKYYFANGRNKKDTGCKFGMSESSVRIILGRHGIEDRKRKTIPKEVKAQICKDYEDGLRSNEICRKYDVTFSTMKGIVFAAGVKRKHWPAPVGKIEKDYLPQLCWKCKKATGGCSWSKNLTPVEGWTAKLVPRVNWDGEMGTNWAISKCPEFEKE